MEAFDRNDPCPLERFEQEYDLLLTNQDRHARHKDYGYLSIVLHSLPDRRPASDLDPKIEVCEKLAAKHNCIYLPMQSIFNKAVNVTTSQGDAETAFTKPFRSCVHRGGVLKLRIL